MTNPNPVAPKTDTPATQVVDFTPETIRDYLYGIEARALSEYQHSGNSEYLSEALTARIQMKRMGYGTELTPKLEARTRELESTLAAERASRLQAEWISVKYQLPEEGVEVLCYSMQTRWVGTYRPRCPCETKWHGKAGATPDKWMPLPSKPSVSPEQEKP